MKRITVIGLGTAAATAMAACVWACTTFTVHKAVDGYLMLYKSQSDECDAGGGCTVLSRRETIKTMNLMFQHGAEAAVEQFGASQQCEGSRL